MQPASAKSDTDIASRLALHLDACVDFVANTQTCRVNGRLARANGLVLEATGPRLPIGAMARIQQEDGRDVEAEVVGFERDALLLMPTGETHGMQPGACVTALEPPRRAPKWDKPHHPWRRSEDQTRHLPVGEALLGRVIDAGGRPLDGLGAIETAVTRPLIARARNPMQREPVQLPLDVGVRAIDAMLTVGRGQRVGLFAGSGVGKSVLLGMMARYTKADVVVVGLIGERGREVKEFVEQILGPHGLARAAVVAAPADVSPLARIQGALYACAIAEHFRDQGRHVLLIMDSLTRYAMALREIALAIGEPPATKGYPPSVFARLPSLVERAGNGSSGGGSITAFYTVLTEGDDQQDPIADAARAILDGHIVLSRLLAEQGHYPAIDIEQSISRVMHAIADDKQMAAAIRVKQQYSKYQRSRDLISVGAYAAGSDLQLDHAIAAYPQIEKFLRQGIHERSDASAARAALAQLGAT